ncbi:MAG TPA: hypothetical protein VKC34_00450 [Blastocatellia bacterium]|nr:hypothetical protein [Blastocatellia bacterium]
MTTYTVRVKNPIIDQEMMKIETEIKEIALMEAALYSKRIGVASVIDNSSNSEIARFRYGVEEPPQEQAYFPNEEQAYE